MKRDEEEKNQIFVSCRVCVCSFFLSSFTCSFRNKLLSKLESGRKYLQIEDTILKNDAKWMFYKTRVKLVRWKRRKKTEQQDFRLVFDELATLNFAAELLLLLLVFFFVALFSSRNIDKVYWTFTDNLFLSNKLFHLKYWIELLAVTDYAMFN